MTAEEKLASLSDDEVKQIWKDLLYCQDIDWHAPGPYEDTETVGYWAMMVDIERCRRKLSLSK